MSFPSTRSVEIEAHIDPAELDRAQQLRKAIDKVSELSRGWLDTAIAEGMGQSSAFDEESRVVMLRVAINGADFYGYLHENDTGECVTFYDYDGRHGPDDAPKLPYPEDISLNRTSDPRVMIVDGEAAQVFNFEEMVYSQAEEDEIWKGHARVYGWRDGTEPDEEPGLLDDIDLGLIDFSSLDDRVWGTPAEPAPKKPKLRVVPPVE